MEEALIKTRHQILAIQRKLSQELGSEHAEILNAHLLVLEDQSVREEIINGLRGQKQNVEAIFDDVLHRHLKAFARTEDEYLRERAADIEDIRKRVLRNLLGKQPDALKRLDQAGILVAPDPPPPATAQMHKRHVLAFITDIGGGALARTNPD